MMRNAKAIACLILLLSLPAAPCAAQGGTPAQTKAPEVAARSGPCLQLQEIAHDFGAVMEGEHLEHVFQVRNTGAEELVIEHVRPG